MVNHGTLKRIAAAGVTLGAVAASVVGCSSANYSSVQIYAASSLTKVFTGLKAEFEHRHPHTKVVFNFAGSAELATQIVEGAPADVFAAASTTTMVTIVDKKLVAQQPINFATNILEIAVAKGNPHRINSLAALANSGVTVVLCAPAVPCGAAARKVLSANGINLHPVSEETNVNDVVGKIASGEADAGLVYHTDILAAVNRISGVQLAKAEAGKTLYPIAVLKDSAQISLAQQWIDYVRGTDGMEALTKAGFGKP